MRPLGRGLAVVLALSGCSAIFIDKPAGRPPPGVPLNCTESRVVPWIDTYVAALSLVGTIVALAGPCNQEEFGCLQRVLVVPFGGMAIGYGISAVLGHDAVTTCREFKNSPPTPPPPTPPPPPMPAASPPGLEWMPMVAGAAGLAVHSAPADVAPMLATLPAGTTVPTRPAGVDGWLVVRLPDGRAGYVRTW